VQVKENELSFRHNPNSVLVWALVALATIVLNAVFHTLIYLDGCTPDIGYGTPMGGGECQGFVESFFGFVGFVGTVCFVLLGWPAANIVLGLYLSKELKISKLFVFALIFVLAPGTIAALRYLYPSFAPD
jgi:hypothetical protein